MELVDINFFGLGISDSPLTRLFVSVLVFVLIVLLTFDYHHIYF